MTFYCSGLLLQKITLKAAFVFGEIQMGSFKESKADGENVSLLILIHFLFYYTKKYTCLKLRQFLLYHSVTTITGLFQQLQNNVNTDIFLFLCVLYCRVPWQYGWSGLSTPVLPYSMINYASMAQSAIKTLGNINCCLLHQNTLISRIIFMF